MNPTLLCLLVALVAPQLVHSSAGIKGYPTQQREEASLPLPLPVSPAQAIQQQQQESKGRLPAALPTKSIEQHQDKGKSSESLVRPPLVAEHRDESKKGQAQQIPLAEAPTKTKQEPLALQEKLDEKLAKKEEQKQDLREDHLQAAASSTKTRLVPLAIKQAPLPDSTFSYPQSPARQLSAPSKTTIDSRATKARWYQQPTKTSAPLQEKIEVQQQLQQHEELDLQQEIQQQEHIDDRPAPLGLAEPFAFDYKHQDPIGNGQYRREEGDRNGAVRGSYGYTDASGQYRHVDYVADRNGFRAKIRSNEPGLVLSDELAAPIVQALAPVAPLVAPAPPNVVVAAIPAIRSAERELGTQPRVASASSNDHGEWSVPSINDDVDDLSAAAAPPAEFESSHRGERLRSPKALRN